MSKSITKKSALLLAILLIISIPSTVLAQGSGIDYEYIDYIIQLIDNFYIDDVSTQQHQNNLLKGLLNNLDRYTTYYTKDEYMKFMETMNGSFVGIGAYIKEENGEVVVVSTITGSNAEKAGLKSGDVIVRVGFRNVQGMDADQVSSLIRGKEGTNADVYIRRNGRFRLYRIERSLITINPVRYEVIGDDIGYIILEDFTADATYEVRRALNYMDEKKIENIILDLRNNPGGYLDQAINISRLFVPKGPIVSIKDGNGNVTRYDSYLQESNYNLVVLVNENSASASEIVAAAVNGRDAGYIIGSKTFGKGSVQSLLQLPKGDGIKITIAEYFGPYMNKINGVGVTPHLIIANDLYDIQLEKAIEYFE